MLKIITHENGLKQNLERVQERLSQEYAYDDDRTIREVLELEAKG